mmetsp:Transcript_55315/g.108249  ORF Transcript_55315/g.108249 Transcript_55315/m.108249 type:complete len:268 (-) Transcript_55315:2113-2916(-)
MMDSFHKTQIEVHGKGRKEGKKASQYQTSSLATAGSGGSVVLSPPPSHCHTCLLSWLSAQHIHVSVQTPPTLHKPNVTKTALISGDFITEGDTMREQSFKLNRITPFLAVFIPPPFVYVLSSSCRLSTVPSLRQRLNRGPESVSTVLIFTPHPPTPFCRLLSLSHLRWLPKAISGTTQIQGVLHRRFHPRMAYTAPGGGDWAHVHGGGRGVQRWPGGGFAQIGPGYCSPLKRDRDRGRPSLSFGSHCVCTDTVRRGRGRRGGTAERR